MRCTGTLFMGRGALLNQFTHIVRTIVLKTYSSIAVVSAPAIRRFEAVISISSYEMPVGVSRFLITCSMLGGIELPF